MERLAPTPTLRIPSHVLSILNKSVTRGTEFRYMCFRFFNKSVTRGTKYTHLFSLQNSPLPNIEHDIETPTSPYIRHRQKFKPTYEQRRSHSIKKGPTAVLFESWIPSNEFWWISKLTLSFREIRRTFRPTKQIIKPVKRILKPFHWSISNHSDIPSRSTRIITHQITNNECRRVPLNDSIRDSHCCDNTHRLPTDLMASIDTRIWFEYCTPLR